MNEQQGVKGKKKVRHRVRTKVKVQFWWEIYRLLVTTPAFRKHLNLDRDWTKTKRLYGKWGDVTRTNYDTWWKDHRLLFLDEISAVRLIEKNHFRRHPDCVYLECNLKRPPSSLLPIIRYHLRNKLRELNRSGKVKTQIKTVFSFTDGKEIRPAPYRDYIKFLKEVYAPNCEEPRPMEMRRYAQSLYAGKKRGIGSLHLDGRDDRTPIAYLSMDRYLKKVQALCRAVARGEFPGRA